MNTKNVPKQYETIASPIEPEFCRIDAVEPIFGISPGMVYKLIRQGHLRASWIGEPGKRRGVTLVQIDSIRAFLRSRIIDASSQAAIPVGA